MLSAVAIDGFESGNFDGGTEQWAGDGGWSVSGDASVRTDGPNSGNYHARLRRNTGDLQRTVDVSGLTDVELKFSARSQSFESSDQAHVRVSGDDAATSVSSKEDLDFMRITTGKCIPWGAACPELRMNAGRPIKMADQAAEARCCVP
jgi:hypothetical protein